MSTSSFASCANEASRPQGQALGLPCVRVAKGVAKEGSKGVAKEGAKWGVKGIAKWVVANGFAMVVASVVACGVSCSLPLSSRRAQVLEPGELEASAAGSGGALFGNAAVGSFTSSYVPALGMNASLRFGLVERIDLQLRVLDLLVPEVSAGWQLIGDPTKNDLALTLTGGVGPVFGFGFSSATGTVTQFGAYVPLQLLVDVPVGDGALTFAFRGVTSGSRTDGGGATAYGLSIAPGLTASWTVPLGGGVFVRPEVAGNVPIPVVTTGAQDVGGQGQGGQGNGAIVMVALAFGYEFRLDDTPAPVR
jgi:hypothetical protein